MSELSRGAATECQSCPKQAGKPASESFSLGRRWPARSASPTGRSLKKGPDEGGNAQCFGIRALTRRFAPPSPGGRGTREKQVSTFANRLEAAWGWGWRRSAIRNLDNSAFEEGRLRPKNKVSRYLKQGA